jgi:hypothetical protein
MRTNRRGIFCTSFLALTVAVALLVTMSGCVGINFGSSSMRTIEGSGDVVTQSFDVADFSRVRIDGDYVVSYTESADYSVSVEMQESLFDYITVESSDDELRIFSEEGTLHNSVSLGDGFDLVSNRAPRVNISAPTLAGLNLAGTFQVGNSSPVKGQGFALNLSGAGDVELELAVEKLTVDIAGAASLNLSGTAADADIKISGSGEIDALELATKTAAVDISGAGAGSITCSDTLDVEISGSGLFEYAGDPILTKDVAGLGIVEKVG